MREEQIDRIVEKLGEAWKKVPDWRLGQLVSNLQGTGPQDVFHLQDERAEELLEAFNDGDEDEDLVI